MRRRSTCAIRAVDIFLTQLPAGTMNVTKVLYILSYFAFSYITLPVRLPYEQEAQLPQTDRASSLGQTARATKNLLAP